MICPRAIAVAWIAVAWMVGLELGCSGSPAATPTATPAASASCAIPPGAGARIRAAVPRAGLTCTRYPFALDLPRDVVEARDGTIYVTEMAAGRIVRLTAEGFLAVTTGLAAPIGLREGADGQLYVAEEGGQRVTRVDPRTGTKEEVASGLGYVTYLAIGPDGAVYVSSFTSFAPSGSIKRITLPLTAGSPPVVQEYATGLDVPEGIVIDPGGQLVVAEWNASPSRVVRLPAGGGPADGASPVATGFGHVYGVAGAPAGDIGPSYFVADTAADRVVVTDGVTQVDILTAVTSPAGLVTAANGDLLVVEASGASEDASSAGYLVRLSGF